MYTINWHPLLRWGDADRKIYVSKLGPVQSGRRCRKMYLLPALSVKAKFFSPPPFGATEISLRQNSGQNKRPTCVHLLKCLISLLLWLKVAWVQTSAKHQMESFPYITKHRSGREKKKVKLFIEFHLFSSFFKLCHIKTRNKQHFEVK